MAVPGRRAGLVAGVAGLAAAGVAVGLATERYAIGRIRRGPDQAAAEPFGRLPADRTRTVSTDDGIPLHVEEVGPADAPLTVVFVHGYALSLGSWHYQRRDLAGMRRPRVRLVFYDQRSHGRSGRAPGASATIDRLGRDLDRVLAETAPAGPVVLVGHSMGGMAVLALAGQHPEYFGTRVAGVGLLSTSTGRLAGITLGLPAALARLRTPVMPLVLRGLRRRPRLVERGRRLGADLSWLITRRYSFGSPDVSPALVDYVGRLIGATPVEVIADFYPALTGMDEAAAVSALGATPTLIVVGSADLLTPPAHSEEMAAALPAATLVVLPGAGHLALLERPEAVDRHLRDLLRRATGGPVDGPAERAVS